MESEVTSKATAAAPRPPGLSTVYVPLNHKHHEHANVLYGTVGNPRDSLPDCASVEYLNFFHKVMKAVDSVVAQHAVAKVTGTVEGFMLVTGVLAPQDHPTLALANCALHILRVARQVTLPNGEPLQLKLGLHCGPVYTGMLGTSPPHFQLVGYAARVAKCLADQGVCNFLQISLAAQDALGPVAASSSNWFSGGTVHLWPGESVDVVLTCCDFQKAQMTELLNVLIPRSRFAEPTGFGQLRTLTFSDGELESRFERWSERRTASSELWGSWLLALASLLWVFGEWKLHGPMLEVALWVTGINLVTAVLVLAARNSDPPPKSLRSMTWVSQYAIITQQLAASMLRSDAVRGATERDPCGAPLQLLMLYGSLTLLACSMVRRVRFALHAWATPVLAAMAGGAFAVHYFNAPGGPAAAWGHAAGAVAVAAMLLVPTLVVYSSEKLVRQAYIEQLDSPKEQ